MRSIIIMLILALTGCSDGSPSRLAHSQPEAIPRQQMACEAVSGSAPCCAPPTWSWIQASCPAGTSYIEGVMSSSGYQMGACAADGAQTVDQASLEGPYLQVADGRAVDYWEGPGAGLAFVSCDSSTGRERIVSIQVGPDEICDLRCFTPEGVAEGCDNPCGVLPSWMPQE